MFRGSTLRVLGLTCTVLVLTACAGGTAPHEIVTDGLDGWRIQRFEVDGDRIVYVRTAANPQGEPTQLVLRSASARTERVLAARWRYGDFALDGDAVVWWNAAEDEERGGGPLRYLDLRTDRKRNLAWGRVTSVDVSDAAAIFSHEQGGHTALTLAPLDSTELHTIAPTEESEGHRFLSPQINGRRAVWVELDPDADQYRLVTYDLSAGTDGTPTPTGVTSHRAFEPVLSDDFVAYCASKGDWREVRLYDCSRGHDTLVAKGERINRHVALEGTVVAWAEEIQESDYTPVPGQPLMGPSDFHDIYRFDVAADAGRCLAKNLLTVPPHLDVHAGQVYATVYRTLPPPGSSNLVVPVDLWRW